MSMGKPPTTDDPKRSRTMSRIKSRNTSIEILLRKALWREGIRYRVNYIQIPGTPDIAITKHKIAVFCDGEFWHGMDWKTKKPKIKSNREYWINKIERNMERDREIDRQLNFLDWTVLRFWGLDIKKNITNCLECVKEAIFLKKMASIYESFISDGDFDI